jgi:SAM-dependent methyltransferase
VVVVGQAFHWFRHDEAMPEIHRVLRPRGALVLTWNERDQSRSCSTR